jgi:hypothetical protein
MIGSLAAVSMAFSVCGTKPVGVHYQRLVPILRGGNPCRMTCGKTLAGGLSLGALLEYPPVWCRSVSAVALYA